MSFQKTFKSTILPELKKELGVSNLHQVPQLKSVRVTVGIGSLVGRKADIQDVVKNVERIAGQKSVITKSKKAISNFKLREGMANGIVVTLRGAAMYEFIYRLIHIVLPRVRDFRGLNPKSFDGAGNYSIGFKEALVFPEVNPDDVMNVHGIQITVVTSAKTNKEGNALLTALGFPFQKKANAPSAN